jgi:Cu(I)/Ag(I) efflux system membrane fusion protein
VGGVAVIFSSLLLIGFACKKEMPQKPATVATQKALYHCPMHPTYISDKPGDCPICGMRLVPMEQKPTAEHSDSSSTEMVAGRTTIGLSLERQQLIGVRSEPVIKRTLENAIRTVGEIAYDPEL